MSTVVAAASLREALALVPTMAAAAILLLQKRVVGVVRKQQVDLVEFTLAMVQVGILDLS